MAHTALLIERLLQFSLQHSLIGELDAYVARNTLLDLFGLSEPWADGVPEEHLDVPTVLLDALLDDAAARGLYDGEVPALRVNFEARIMGAVMPRESETAARFEQLRQTQGVRAATGYFYGLCIASNYIRTAQIAKNIKWDYPCKYGRLEITINLTKPEKDPKTIALERLQPAASYPKCMLCIENIGYAGRVNFPARQNHRVVPLTLCRETWYLQYSPYVYYNEHCIVFAHEHAPMAITPRTFEQLFDFVTQFPHYTCGSNADLPIVGGSILSHMHFQGGSYAFPMQSAETLCRYRVPEYPDISVETIRWPVSTVRACGRDAAQLIGFAGRLLETWRGYSDAEADILAETMENGSPTPHNTVTPILHYDEKKAMCWTLYPATTAPQSSIPRVFSIRTGRSTTSKRKHRPHRGDGPCHPAQPPCAAERSHRGGAVRPNGRKSVQSRRTGARRLAGPFGEKIRHGALPEQAQDAVKREIGAKFETCLEHAGVFKLTPDGLAAFDRFLTALGCEKL